MKMPRCFLYSAAKPRGFLFTDRTQAQLDELVASGVWFDHPNKVPAVNQGMAKPAEPVKPAAPAKPAKPIKADGAALQAMFLQGQEMTRDQLLELAKVRGMKVKAVGLSTKKLVEQIAADIEGQGAPVKEEDEADEVPALQPKGE
jgi:hypothetical protein